MVKCVLKFNLMVIKYYLFSYFKLVFLKYTSHSFYRVFIALQLPGYVTCYANACKMCEVFVCFFFPHSLASTYPKLASKCYCICVLCVCVCLGL